MAMASREAQHSTLSLNTGAQMPAIGLGTWQMGVEFAEEAVGSALRAG